METTIMNYNDICQFVASLQHFELSVDTWDSITWWMLFHQIINVSTYDELQTFIDCYV